MLTETQVRAQLHLEEEQRLVEGGESLHATTPSAFIMHGLDLEDSQYVTIHILITFLVADNSCRRRIRRLAHDISTGATSRQSAGLTEQRNLLRSRLRVWEQILPIYMPGLLQYCQDREAELAASQSTGPEPLEQLEGAQASKKKSNMDEIEHAAIWLPSKVDSTARRRVCREGLPQIEERLRSVQLEDSLENIRHILKVKTRMIQFKNKNLRGQHDGTRSRTIIDRVHYKARAAAEKYRVAHAAKMALTGPGDWETTYKVLKDADIRGYQDPNRLRPRRPRRGIYEDDQLNAESTQVPIDNHQPSLSNVELFNDERTRRDGTGETRRTLSWIWVSQVANASTNDGIPDEEDEEDLTKSDDILQAEWAKSRARAMRWTEEVMLIKEEMRRTLAFLHWRADWWDQKPRRWEGVNAQLEEGLCAYAYGQAELQRKLALHFAVLWQDPLNSASDPLPDFDMTPADDPENGDDDDDDDDNDNDNSDDERDEDCNSDDDDEADHGNGNGDGQTRG